MKDHYSGVYRRPADEPGKYYCPKCERTASKLRPQKVDGKIRWFCKCGTVIK